MTSISQGGQNGLRHAILNSSDVNQSDRGLPDTSGIFTRNDSCKSWLALNFLVEYFFLLFSSRDELEAGNTKYIFPCTSYVPPKRLSWCFGLFGST